MTTLTQVAQATKKILILIVFCIIFFSFIYLIFSTVRNIAISNRPAPTPIVMTTFNRIPKITFPEQTFPSDIKFSIETLSGRIPEASPTAKIFFIPKKQQGLLTNVRATQDAKKIGFTQEGQLIDKKLVFQEARKEFTIDPISRNFTFSYDYLNDGSVFQGTNKIDKNSLKTIALNFLNTLSVLPKDYDPQNSKVTLLTFNGAQFIPTAGGSDDENATCGRIDFPRTKIDNLNVVTPKYNEGNIYVVVSKSLDKNKQIIKAQRYYQELSLENVGIYPLRSSNLAWQEFLNGKGYIVQSGNSTFTKRVIIRDSYLAYYDNPEKQTYLIPVYVFIGDEGFVGYANAISSEWLSE